MIGKPAVIMPIELKGHLEGWHHCAKSGLWRKVFDEKNAIDNELKAIIRDNMNAPTDFAMDNLFATDGEVHGGDAFYGEAADPAGKDGIVARDSTNGYWITTITTVHPTDPSGNYYRQWQGVLTNDFGVGGFVVSVEGVHAAKIGTSLAGAAGGYTVSFGYEFAGGESGGGGPAKKI